MTMDGQAFPFFPPPHSRDITFQVGGDFLPGIEPGVRLSVLLNHSVVLEGAEYTPSCRQEALEGHRRHLLMPIALRHEDRHRLRTDERNVTDDQNFAGALGHMLRDGRSQL
jgi:hypothetical protein